mmetsp:Transcript_25533/g.61509  ORF Transcript_25533/g.61509 Transcript_25533/m.61509 type:complete len:310 (+) Transcript_25533:238-1167(+)|eukprot:CAMPEP_0114527674 /NCGR_PEP_ID=MMETSP0109-20121206/23759_1 /TAXON_ID=29199 /ORGANISM="Chlorarachnion reptans, Strain CCCM449" /LENGTH=309 /DNA_ID=CAMNT_0001709689 /DNA_START=197 /DNA_END=1126 /DNA_ORIENTATION=+
MLKPIGRRRSASASSSSAAAALLFGAMLSSSMLVVLLSDGAGASLRGSLALRPANRSPMLTRTARDVQCRSQANPMEKFGELPYRAKEVGLNAAYEMALRKRDVAAVRLLERARNTLAELEARQTASSPASRPPSSPAHEAAGQGGGAPWLYGQKLEAPPAGQVARTVGASSPALDLSGLPYRASEIGVNAALELANRKRDCKGVRILERAKAAMESAGVSAGVSAAPSSYSSSSFAPPGSSPPVLPPGQSGAPAGETKAERDSKTARALSVIAKPITGLKDIVKTFYQRMLALFKAKEASRKGRAQVV